MNNPQQIDLPGCFCWLYEGFFNELDSYRLHKTIFLETDWRQESVSMYGKRVNIPRLTAWHGDPGASYAYSGIKSEPAPWTKSLLEIKYTIEELCCGPLVFHETFNSCLLNFYRDGRDSVSWHSDDEPELGPDPVICSVSFGADRVFQFRHKTTGQRVDCTLTNGSVLVMGMGTQVDWQHQIPKTKKPIGTRLNLTFRHIESR